MRLDDLKEALDQHGAAVLVLVAEAKGSAPREAGAAMLVTNAGALGTVGGGAAEARAVDLARAMLEGGAAIREERIPLGPEIDQCCGGGLRLALRRFERGDLLSAPLALWPDGPVFEETRKRPVHLYGAGHVGRAIARALAPLDYQLTWVDPRPGAFEGVETEAETIITPLPEAVVAEAPADALHLVLTHSHAADLEIVSAILGRGVFGFCGVIGSATKRALFLRRLAERGIPADRLTCPIGLPGLRDKRPAAIAASVAAQLLLLEQEAVSAP